jgi:serine/threonine-protein kinase
MTTERDQIAQALPAYVVGEELGRGAFGVVWAGEHRRVGRRVAIKHLTAIDAVMKGRFLAEAQVLASLEHPHVVPLYDYVEDGESCLLVMERLEGGTLGERFSLPRKVGVASACAVAMVACAALHHAHRKGVLHRDVKPDNLLFSAEGILKVTDFGIAKLVIDGVAQSGSTEIGTLKGTPAYMAPEQVVGQGGLGPGVDIYATGLLLYELLSGELPFSEEGSALVVAFRRLHQDPERIDAIDPEVPRELADVVMQALNRLPVDRFASAEDFGVAIGRAACASLGPGWLDHSRVALLAPGPIMDSAHVARSYGGPAFRQGPTVDDVSVGSSATPDPSADNRPPAPPVFVAPEAAPQQAASPADTRPDPPSPPYPTPAPPYPAYPTPADGGPSPAYGAPSPAYGGPSPAYGGPPPAYRGPAPAPPYGGPAPGYGGPPPAYGGPAPAYGGPAPAYGGPAPAYGGPAPGYGGPGPLQAPLVGPTSEMQPSAPTDEEAFEPAPWTAPPPQVPEPPRKRGMSSAMIGAIIAAVVVVVAGVTAAIVLTTNHGGGVPTTTATVTTAATPTTIAPATTPPTSAGVSAAQAAATQLAGLLQQSNGARNLVVMATQTVGGCQEDPRNGIAQVQTAITERDAVIHNLGTVPLTALPNGPRMVAALNTGLQASVEADRHYIDWMTDMVNTGSCPISDPALQSAATASQQATAAKQTFVGLWNPIAAQFNLTQYAEKDL